MAAQPSRRDLLTRLARVTGGAVIGGGAWAAWIGGGSARAAVQSTAIRPPGARPEAEFRAACIKCGACSTACPYDAIKLADLFDVAPIGTPYLVVREVACEMCEDIPCVRPCPTGALDRDMAEIDDARMGVPVLDPQNCLSMQGLRCEACYRACPVIDRALRLEYRHQARTGVHAFFEPVIDPEYCTGCGQCEHACITERPAIRVLPRALVQGRVGDHYRFGWKNGEQREPVGAQRATPAPDGKGAIDYLNKGLGEDAP